MKYNLFFVIAFLSFQSCKSQIDYAILDYPEIVKELISYKSIPELAQSSNLSNDELDTTLKLMNESISNYNSKIKDGFREKGHPDRAKRYIIKKLKNYKIQIIPYVNAKGEKEIWINGLCNTWDADWTKEIVYVFDGGNCYFNIKLNLETKECLAIGTNGYA